MAHPPLVRRGASPGAPLKTPAGTPAVKVPVAAAVAAEERLLPAWEPKCPPQPDFNGDGDYGVGGKSALVRLTDGSGSCWDVADGALEAGRTILSYECSSPAGWNQVFYLGGEDGYIRVANARTLCLVLDWNGPKRCSECWRVKCAFCAELNQRPGEVFEMSGGRQTTFVVKDTSYCLNMNGGDLQTQDCRDAQSFAIEEVPPEPFRPMASASLHAFRYQQWYPIGNALSFYWNERARGVLEGKQVAVLEKPTDREGTDGVAEALCDWADRVPLTALQEAAARTLRASRDACMTCPYPALYRLAPWQLIPHIITAEMRQAAAQLVRRDSFRALSPRTAAYHLRCDTTILEHHDDYGLLPHRFLMRRLAREVTHVYLVGNADAFDQGTVCGKAAHDLMSELTVKMGVTSSPVTGDPRADWLFLATAPTLFCSPSSFCLAAAQANPGTSYLAMTSGRSSIQGPSPKLGPQWLEAWRQEGIHWVDTDFIGGKALSARRAAWPLVQEYLRGDSCDERRFGCTLPAADSQ